MKLSYFSVKNFRSITLAYKMEIRNTTVLLGKNNEGKTNVLKALLLSMEILKNTKYFSKKATLPRSMYDWREDYPIHLQKTATKNPKYTTFRFDFQLSESETEELYKRCNSKIRKHFSISIDIAEDNVVSITIFKRGKNTKENFSEKAEEICKYLCSCIDVQYVPAIRSERDALLAISSLVDSEFSNTIDDEDTIEYLKAKEIIEKYQTKKLEGLETRLNLQLKQFMPKVKKVKIGLVDKYTRTLFRKDIDVEIDDGVLTSISKKGDGVKSLVTIALLSQVRTSKNRIIIIDEPENHLHPEAVHYIKKVLAGIPNNNQVIISTHSPIFVNRNDVKSNIIVRDSKAEPANRIDDIRKILGILTSDNLQYADYVIIVEGLTDKRILKKYFDLYIPEISALINANKITIRSIGGVNNLLYELMGLERYYCKYLVLLDYDEAGRTIKKESVDKLSIEDSVFRFITKPEFRNSEMEDLINEDVFRDYLLSKSIDISIGLFKNKTKKWADRLDDIAKSVGIIMDSAMLDEIKFETSKLVEQSDNPFTDSAKILLNAIAQKVKDDVSELL